jgi:hypothetical protein
LHRIQDALWGVGELMAAKPRVHEIASEFGVNVKILLRMLKEDGEFVKGPSSSVEPAVARRLRARLVEDGDLERNPTAPPSPRVAGPPRPVPAPPGTLSRAVDPAPHASARTVSITEPVQPVPAPAGTRWRTSEPLVPYTQPEPPAPAKEPTSLAVAGSPDRRPSMPRDAPASPTQSRHDLPSTDWRSAAFVPPLSTPGARLARARQERADAAARFSAERAKREARPRLRAADEEILTEEESRARARQSVVTRVDNGWKLYGISRAEREGWKDAGLSPGQAHIPAMCRAFGARGWGITPGMLRVQLKNGRTAQQEFDAGSNIVQVLELLAAARKGHFRGEFDPRVAAIVPILRAHPPARPDVDPLRLGDLTPAGVPKIADYLLRFALPSQDERSIDAFNREREGFERTGRTGPLVKLYAEAHGVFGDLNLTRTLLQNVPLHVANRGMRLPFVSLLSDALRERQFYYLSATATLAVEEDADRRIPVPEEYDLPTPTGFALMRDPDQDGGPAGRILLWSHGARELAATILSVSDLAVGLTEYPTVQAAPTGAVAGDGAEVALALVAAIGVATRRPSSGDLDTDARRAPQRPSVGTVKPRPAKRPVDESGEPVDFVSLIYAPGEAHFEEASTATGRKAEKRWVVRGHWRQQWYSSRGERHPLWIKAHEAGAEEGELLTGDRVKVAR